MPARHSKSVVLPAPFGPIKPKTSPCRTLKLTFRSTVRAPNCLERPLTVNRFIVNGFTQEDAALLQKLTLQKRCSEGEPHLQLEHPRRVDVCERRNRVGCRAHAGGELAESG